MGKVGWIMEANNFKYIGQFLYKMDERDNIRSTQLSNCSQGSKDDLSGLRLFPLLSHLETFIINCVH